MKEVIVNAEDLVCLNKEKLQELIRCTECKFYSNDENELSIHPLYCVHKCILWRIGTFPDDFCSRAERKEE